MLKQSGAFRANQQVAERVMDSGDIERERGITILAKNCSCEYNGVKINIVDTPGHADFGGEVGSARFEDGQRRSAAGRCSRGLHAPDPLLFCRRLCKKNLSLVIAVNKIDRPDARIAEVIDEILELLMDLGATDEQLDSPMVFCSGRNGTASYDWTDPSSGTDLKPLFDTILKYVQPPVSLTSRCRCWFPALTTMISSAAWALAACRTARYQGRQPHPGLRLAQPRCACERPHHQLFDFKANGREPIERPEAGDIVAFAGLPDISIRQHHLRPSKGAAPCPSSRSTTPRSGRPSRSTIPRSPAKEGVRHLPPDP